MAGNVPTGELTNYQPSWRDRLADLMASTAHGISGKPYSEARRDSMTLLGLAPVTGQVMAAEDAGSAARHGDYLGAALAGLGAVPAIGPEARALATGERAAGREALAEAKAGITAYHGSPHSFDQFDPSKIGTGEGAQVFGHGLYFAENEGVARSYRDALTGQNPTVQHYLGLAQGDRPAALSAFDRHVAGGAFGDKISAEELSNIRSQIEKPAGHMYEVNINADPEHFLDWDKPVVGQPAYDLLKSNWHSTSGNADLVAARLGIDPETKGSDLHNIFGGGPRAPVTSNALSEAGIPGIKYLDAGSRTAGEGSRNYVVFDPKIITIVKKYGIAGALGAGLISQEMAGQMQKQGVI